MDWQDIESAPKDGTKIVASLKYEDGPPEAAIIAWNDNQDGYPWKILGGDPSLACAQYIPTHWLLAIPKLP